MFKKNKICGLFNIKLPIIQAGMEWVSTLNLAAASSEAGILGLIGSASMTKDELKAEIEKTKKMTKKAFGVNIPLFLSDAREKIDISLQCGIRIFFTSAGSPDKYTKYLKDKGAIVVHVVSTPYQAMKSEQAGCDAVVAEGFEAGGHNGRDELTTFVLVPQVVDTVRIPVIAAGGIMDGRGIVAALSFGAQGVQMGTRFIATKESAAHVAFKNLLLSSDSDSTMLVLRDFVPVRIFKNKFYHQIVEAEKRRESKEVILNMLKGRTKLGMVDGDIEEGELEVGQGCGLIKDIPSVAQLVETLEKELFDTIHKLTDI